MTFLTHRVQFDASGQRCPKSYRQVARRPECGTYDRMQPFVPHNKPIPPVPPRPPVPPPRPPVPPPRPPVPPPRPPPTPPPPTPPFIPPTPAALPSSSSGGSSGIASAALAGGVLGGGIGGGVGRALSGPKDYTRIPQEIEMTETGDIEEGVVRASAREIRPPGLRFRPRVDPRELEEFGEESRVQQASQTSRNFFQNMRTRLGTEYESVPQEEEIELTNLQDIEFGNIEAAEGGEAEATEAVAETSAQVTQTSMAETQASQTVTRTAAQADVEMEEFTDLAAEGAPEAVEATEAVAGLTEISGAEAAALTGEEALAVGGETMATAFGVGSGAALATTGGVETTVAGEIGLASAAEGAGIELGAIGTTEAVVAGGETAAAAGAGALTGAFNPATDVADVFTLGLASVVGAAVGAGIGTGIAVAASQPHDPTPGIKQLSADDLKELEEKLPKDSLARKTIANAKGQPLYYVTTDSKQNVLVAQLTQTDLARARAALLAKPDLFLHHDAQTLKAMGINPSLAGTPYQKGTNPFAKRIPPIPASLQQQAEVDHSKRTRRRLAQETVTQNAARIAKVTDPSVRAYLTAKLQLYKWTNGLITGPRPNVPPPPNTPESVAALAAYNQRLSEARVRSNQSKVALGSARATLAEVSAKASSARTALSTARVQQSDAATHLSKTTAVAQAEYAARVTQSNQRVKMAVDRYNTQLMSGLHQMADQYSSNTSVAQTNIRIAQQATAPTRLLGTNIKSAYAAAQQTYTPVSTTLPK